MSGLVALLTVTCLLPKFGTGAASDLGIAAARRPIAMAVWGSHLYIANHRSGSVSIVEPVSRSVVGELSAGKQISDVIALPARGILLATDEASGRLLALRPSAHWIQVIGTFDVGYSPVSICPAPDGTWCAVALLWAHRIALVDVGASDALRVRTSIDLPFAPRKQCLGPDGTTLIVADSFGGNLALIDVPSATLKSVRTIQAHNIRGLAVGPDGRELWISHPLLEQGASTNESNVFWGSVIGNVLRVVSWDELVNAIGATGPAPVDHWSMYALGDPGNAAGDPGPMLFDRAGHAIVALSGVDEVAIGPMADGSFRRLKVGRGPGALALAPDGKTLYVANTFDDSISVVDLSSTSPRVIATISLGPRPRLSDADRGEQLFHSARLSRDGWYSCNTCHTDGHTCGLKNDNFSDGSFGTPKRILTLMGAGQTGPWGWTGSSPSLEEQVHKSILATMQGRPEGASAQNASDIAAYVRTLPAPPSLAEARGTFDAAAVARGRRAFEELECTRCHEPPTYTSLRTYDVGLADEAGWREFNPPSLLGASQLPAYFHDNRAATLRDVLVRFKHPDGQEITGRRLEDLLAFLESR